MTIHARTAAISAGLFTLALGALAIPAAGMPPTESPGNIAVGKFQAAWDAVKTYTCKITAHEVQDTHVQDRTYDFWFARPHETRMDITGGAGAGGAAVWHGGDKVAGHQGGFLRFIHLTVDIHDRRATSIRGVTIAEANFGSYLDKIKRTVFKTLDAAKEGDALVITLVPEDPAKFDNIAKETIALGPANLPVEITMYDAAGTVVFRDRYTDLKLNVDIPPGTFSL
jgi:outer membrane lipoprotein-sorting protein